MAITFVDDTADAGQTEFLFNFPYLEDEHVKVFVDGVEQTLTTNFTIQLTPTQAVILSNPTTALTGGEIVRVRRISDPANDLVDFQNGSVLTEAELDRSYLHNRYLAEESAEQNDISLRVQAGADGEFDALNKKIINVSDPTADQDAATKAYVDTKDALKVNKAGDTMSGDLAMGGNKVTGLGAPTSGTDSATKNYVDDTVAGVAAGVIPDGAITTAKIADDAVTSAKTSFTDLEVTDSVNVTSDTSFAKIEVGGPSGGYIDFKAPASDDYDGRLLVGTTTLDIHGKQGVIINTGDPSAVTAIKALANGKVRIGGATDPTHALDVTGDLNITGDYKVNGTNLSTGGTVVSIASGTGLTGGPITTSGTLSLDSIANLRALGNVSGGSAAPVAIEIKDEDAMTSNSATALATQQSIKAYVDSNAGIPTGTVSAFAGSAAPTGYLLCDGSAVNRTAQAALAAVLEDPSLPGTYNWWYKWRCIRWVRRFRNAPHHSRTIGT